MLRTLAVPLLATVAAGFATVAHLPTSWAATFAVNSTADAHDAMPGDGTCATATGDCTLRAAIEEANALPGPDSVSIPAGTCALSLGRITISDDLTLDGSGATSTFIKGAHRRIPSGFSIASGASVQISALTLTRNFAGVGDGGAIVNSGNLTVQDAIISNNRATHGIGGGVATFGSLVLINVTVSGNRAGYGGGVSGATTYINDRLIYNFAFAFGGGADAAGTFVNSIIAHNHARWGGGVSGPGGSFTNVTISNNRAREFGGGVVDDHTFTNCLISNNSTRGNGGGIYGSGYFTNVTIAGNHASNLGGGIFQGGGGGAVLNNVTVANNDANAGGSGLWGDATLSNTLLFGDSTCLGVFTSSGHNLDSGMSCGLTGVGDLSNTDPLLGPLQNNGGFTETMALRPGSPAIDAGDNSNCPATDQRGVPRPQGAACDIGAYEFQP